MPERIAVLFVAGTGRTGSTLVGNLLGSTEGAVSVGEVRHIWNRGFGQNWSCGCGEPFAQCRFWSSVTHEAFGRVSNLDLGNLRFSERQLLRLRNSWRWVRWIDNPGYLYTEHGYYLEVTQVLYRAIAEVSQCDVIVDSSKTPSYGALLTVLPEIDLRLLHLVRDPRATAYSWLNPKPSPDRGIPGSMDRLGARKSALLWAWWNGLAERLWSKRRETPSSRLRYEEFVMQPEVSIRRIVELLAPELANRPVAVDGSVATVTMSHSVSGNPDRMGHGQITIRSDQRWRLDLAPRDRAIVTLLAGPVMKRYGYEKS